MSSSRRDFVFQSMAAAGTVLVGGLGCGSCAEREDDAERVADGWEPAYLELERSGVLAKREERLWSMYRECTCCPRACGVDRIAGETGVCSSTGRLQLASFGPHFGEEAPLVGRHGSGTVFFSNCNLLCVYCLNWEVNHRGDGEEVGHRELADAMLALQRRGCHNIHLVTPTHVVPNIVRALRIAIRGGLRLPLVYNTGGYDSAEVVRLLDGVVDIYLPDFKYQDGELAATYSAEASDYPEVAASTIREMYRQVGDLEVDGRGIARRGLIVRHLVLPHNIAGTDRFVRWVAEELSPTTAVNLMAQYRPEHRAHEYPRIARRLTSEEWRQALDWAQEAGLRSAVRL